MEQIKKKVDLLKSTPHDAASNAQKIRLHSTSELLLMDIEDKLSSNKASKEEAELLTKLKEDLTQFSLSLKLNYARSSFGQSLGQKIIDRLDEFLRVICVCLLLVSSSFYVALPCLMFKPVERVLVEFGVFTPTRLPTTFIRRLLAWCMLTLAGIHLEVQGEEHCASFGAETHLECFSHVSTLDGFMTATAVNVPQIQFMKYELLFIPFFSWHTLAFGGIPLNRRRREQAVTAMADGVARASRMDLIAVAPEGTRSTTGLLLPFKKGPFHLWQQLKCAPVTSIINFGAFELYPPHRIFTMPGKVYLRFLPVQRTLEDDKKRIQEMSKDDAHAEREAMGRRVRRNMLMSMQNVPADAGAPLDARQRADNVFAMVVCLVWHYYLWKIIPFRAIKRAFGLSRLHVYLLVIFGSFALTVAIYVYLYYVVHWIAKAYRIFVPRKKIKAVLLPKKKE